MILKVILWNVVYGKGVSDADGLHIVDDWRNDRKIFLYDTFEGMVKPGDMDGAFEKKEWERMKVNENINSWCLSPVEVQAHEKTGYPNENLVFIKGKLKKQYRKYSFADPLLRLDTDWYESTKHELNIYICLKRKESSLMIMGPGRRGKQQMNILAQRPVYLNRWILPAVGYKIKIFFFPQLVNGFRTSKHFHPFSFCSSWLMREDIASANFSAFSFQRGYHFLHL
ncbi:MAG: hypothetical protein IPP43_12325 [Chitinophagaceae bacterium]|nr:hypothetical protein [Chitinophagaceae bacterium]